MKAQVRKQIKERLAAISASEGIQRSREAARLLATCPEFQAARTVMLYLPIPGEVDTAPLAQACWSAGKHVVCPTACHHCKQMRPIRCGPETAEMFHPEHGLRTPSRSMGECPPEQIDLVIVPALAYDRRGNRLGRGGGFYDRFLAQAELRATTAGLVFSEQILPEVPIASNDQPVGLIVTDTEVIRPAARCGPT